MRCRRNTRRELAQLQANAPAMGWAFVKRRMATELGPDWQAKFQKFDKEASFAASLGQVHHAILPRSAARGGGQAAVSRHGVGARGRPRPAQGRVRDRPALRPRDQDRRDPGRDHARACARSSIIAARPGTSRSTATCCATSRTCMCPRPCRDYSTDRLLTMSWLAGRAAAQLEGAQPGGAGRARHQHVPRLVRAVLFLRRDPRRPASRQLQRPAGRLGQPDGFRLRARLSAAFRSRLDRALSRPDERRPRPGRGGLRGLGIYGPEPRHDRRAEPLGRVSLRPADGRPTAPPDRGHGRGPRPGHGAERVRRAAPHGRRAAAARVRVHGSRRDRAGRGVHPPARLDQLAPPVREPDRRLRRRCAGGPPARRPRRRRGCR